MLKAKLDQNNKEFLSLLKKAEMSEDDVLFQIQTERNYGDNHMKAERLLLEYDLNLLRNKKKNKDKIGDTTLFNVHTNLMARSFQTNSPIRFKGEKNGVERQVKMLSNVWKEDTETPYMKSLQYYKDWDKLACGPSITIKSGWNGYTKTNIFNTISPLLAVPDPAGDYFIGEYSFFGFSQIKTKEILKAEGYKIDEITRGETVDGAIEQKRKSQQDQNYLGQQQDDLIEVYYHFFIVDGIKVWALVSNGGKELLDAGIIPPGNKDQEKDPSLIKFPLAFEYWKPLRDSFLGDRPANYVRDAQLVKAELANLRLDKARAELYPMYLYNQGYVNGKDLTFGFNKGIPVDTGINPSIPLDNIIRPVQKDLRIDTSIAIEQLIDRQVEKSTSIGEATQGTTPSSRETATTNQIVQNNTEINLSLNEEIGMIGKQQFVELWFNGYYQNFNNADKKVIYAGSSTGSMPLILKRKDFILENNLTISIENVIKNNADKMKTALAYRTTAPLILGDESINIASKRITLRRVAEANGISPESIEAEIPKTPQMKVQELENELLADGEFVEINPDDDDEQHLIELGSYITTPEAELHRYAHIQASIRKSKPAPVEQMNQGMLNSMNSAAIAQNSSQMANQVNL